MKTCYIFGAAQGLPNHFSPSGGDLVIAADGGYESLAALGVIPQLVVGDFDSLTAIPNGITIIKHPKEKDDTDMMLAVKIGYERGYRRFVLYGGTGGRMDHTFANFQVLCWLSHRKARAFLAGEDFTATAITDDTLRFTKSAEGNISVFAAAGTAQGVFLDGLAYPLENATLTADFPLGVSNEFTGEPSSVRVKKGTLLIIFGGGLHYIQEEA